MKLAFLFRTAPHGNAISREGLDALLAATAFCDEEEIEQRFVCADSLDQYNLQTEQLIISAEKIDRTSLINKLSQAEKVFTF